jgi:hypothetical protein
MLYNIAISSSNSSERETITDNNGLVPSLAPPSFSTFEQFEQKIHHEWIVNSSIAADLFAASVNILPDLEMAPGGEVSTPLHDVLGWSYTRFGTQARPTLYAACLTTLNPERGWQPELFQAKLSSPLLDRKKGKPRKYESPKGFGVRGGFSPIPDRLWQEIARQHDIPIACPLDKCPLSRDYSFWQWVEDHPTLPITVTEGYKKAQHLLTRGHIAIALSGITMGVFNPDAQGRRLRPYLQLFAQPGRAIVIAFDAETKRKTRRDVQRETRKLAQGFARAGCLVFVLSVPLLSGTDKTGIDDYGVAMGEAATEQLYATALPVSTWLWKQRHQAQRTQLPWLRLDSPQLQVTDLAHLPATGIAVLDSPKGSGKTAGLAHLVAGAEKVVLLTHRVCLGRNLAERIAVDWKSDLDKGQGRWIAEGERPTQRIALCVDSLLALDPQDFWGCQLLVDEVDQVFHHLLCSSTCNKDGKRPALLARLHELVQVSQRVVAASADITDAELDYLQTLKGEAAPLHLIRNTYLPQGYPVRLLASPTKDALVAQLLADVKAGRKVFVATDAKSDSKAIAQLLRDLEAVKPGLRVMLVNSETSGGEVEVEFIRHINQHVTDYDVVIATPSLATGVSIEVEHFDLVYGLFTGVLPDSDIAQALARVRAAIPRVVWCPDVGKNFSRVSRSAYPVQVKQAIQTQWDRETQLIRTSLRPDISAIVEDEFTLQDNPHLNYWCRVTARTNESLWNLRSNLLERLQAEGNQVAVEVPDSDDPDVAEQLKVARQQAKQAQCEAIASARILTKPELQQLQARDSRTPTQLLDEQKTKMAEFYGVADVTPELVALDNGGRLRGQIVELEALLEGRDYSIHRDQEAIARQAQWQKGIFLPDQPCHELRRFVQEGLGLTAFLDPQGEWSEADLAPIGDRARQYAHEVQQHLGFSLPDAPEQISNGWIFRRLLLQLGGRVSVRRVGGRGEQVKLYRIDSERWEFLQGVIERRRQRRLERQQQAAATVSTPLIDLSIQMGVDTEPEESPSFEHEPYPSKGFRIGEVVKWLERSGEWVVNHVGTAFAQLQRPQGGSCWMAALDELRPQWQ